MKITQVKVYPYTKKKLSGEIGIGQVVLDDMILLTGLRLIERKGKRFVLYPVNYKNKRQLCFVQPIKKEIADEITTALFNNYETVKNTHMIDIDSNLDDSAFNAGIQDMINTYTAERELSTLGKILEEHPSNGPDVDEEPMEMD